MILYLEFNFVSPAYPVSVGTDNLTCTLKIDHGCPREKRSSTCQLKIDFTELIIQPPLLGSCSFDKMFINANGKYPILCGENSGHHMYLDVKGRASTDLNIVLEKLEQSLYECPDKFGIFMPDSMEKLSPTERQSSKYPSVNLATAGNLPTASFSHRRAWKIKVEQIECGCSTSPAAPDGCLQYYNGISGIVEPKLFYISHRLFIFVYISLICLFKIRFYQKNMNANIIKTQIFIRIHSTSKVIEDQKRSLLCFCFFLNIIFG